MAEQGKKPSAVAPGPEPCCQVARPWATTSMAPRFWLRRLPEGQLDESAVAGASDVKSWALAEPDTLELGAVRSKTSWHWFEAYWASSVKVTSVVMSAPPLEVLRDTRPEAVWKSTAPVLLLYCEVKSGKTVASGCPWP